MTWDNNLEVPVSTELFAPDYMDLYYESWRHLEPQAKRLGVPILYLQRHTLELALKAVLGTALESKKNWQLAHDVFASGVGAHAPS